MEINQNFRMIGKWKAIVKKAATGELVSEQEYENLAPTVGRTALAIQMAGTNTQEVQIKHIAVGSSVTAPTNADTQLGTETARKAVGSATNTNNIASIAAFFAAGEATGTHREFGAFGDGNTTASSLTANTGILYSHVAANTVVAADETLTLTYSVTFL